MIWKRHSTLEQLNAMGEGNMVGLLDIRFEAITDDAIIATMPVDSRTHQPFGLLHGGASVVLAETLGGAGGERQPHSFGAQRQGSRRVPGAAYWRPSPGVANRNL